MPTSLRLILNRNPHSELRRPLKPAKPYLNTIHRREPNNQQHRGVFSKVNRDQQDGYSLRYSAKVTVYCTARNCLAARDTIVPTCLTLWGFAFRSLNGRGRWRLRKVGPETVITYVLVQALLNLSIAHNCAFRDTDNRSERTINLDSLFQKTTQC